MIIDKTQEKCNPEYFTKSRPKFLRISQKKKMRRPKAAHPDLQILIKLLTDTRLYVYQS